MQMTELFAGLGKIGDNSKQAKLEGKGDGGSAKPVALP
jgi:hypothetical protein